MTRLSMRTLATVLAVAALPATGVFAATFAEMDADTSGGLSLAEVQAAYPTATDVVFAEIDTNADGAVDEPELTAAVDAGTLVAASE